MRVAILGKGEVSLFQIEIPPNTKDRAVNAVRMPDEAVLVAVQRGDTVHVPSPGFDLRAGDRVMAVGNVDLEEAVRTALLATDAGDDGPGFELEPRMS
jgi:Trk K+ transport system NAD-binding subunit